MYARFREWHFMTSVSICKSQGLGSRRIRMDAQGFTNVLLDRNGLFPSLPSYQYKNTGRPSKQTISKHGNISFFDGENSKQLRHFFGIGNPHANPNCHRSSCQKPRGFAGEWGQAETCSIRPGAETVTIAKDSSLKGSLYGKPSERWCHWRSVHQLG